MRWISLWMTWISCKLARKMKKGEVARVFRNEFHFFCRNRQPWYDPTTSFSPAVHRMKQALFHAAIVPDLTNHPCPPPHPELTRYFEPPSRVLKRAKDSLETCRTVFKTAVVVKKTFKRKERHVEGEDEDILLGPSTKFAKLEAQGSSAMEVDIPDTVPMPIITQRPVVEESDTEPEEDGPGREPSPELELNSGTAEGRIVGTTLPLNDFKRNVKDGDLVSKAVEDLFYVIQEILLKPFASRRHSEMLDCLRELRKVCSNEDEIEAWNE
jgi:ATP-dependent DNA helicase 2 subunit 2